MPHSLTSPHAAYLDTFVQAHVLPPTFTQSAGSHTAPLHTCMGSQCPSVHLCELTVPLCRQLPPFQEGSSRTLLPICRMPPWCIERRSNTQPAGDLDMVPAGLVLQCLSEPCGIQHHSVADSAVWEAGLGIHKRG